MKKIFPILFTLLLLCLLAFTASAAEPIIVTQPDDVTAELNEEVILTCEATPAENETLLYAWYSTTDIYDNGIEVSMPSENGIYYLPDTSTPGTVFYYCVVFAVNQDKNDMVRSNLVAVTVVGDVKVDFPVITANLLSSYSVKQGAELDIEIECEEMPSPIQFEYEWYLKQVGEDEFTRQSQNSALYIFSTDTAGEYQIMCRVSAVYGASKKTSQSQIATVRVEEHIHEFGDWTVVSNATCMTEGEECRYCLCGTCETRTIPTLDHDFGQWEVVKEATVYSAGKQRRTCSRCGLSEVQEIEPVKYEEPEITHITEETEVTETVSVQTTEVTSTLTEQTNSDNTEKVGKQFPFWTLIIIFGIVSTVVGGALSAWFFLKYRIGKEKRNKYLQTLKQNQQNQKRQQNNSMR